MRALLVLASVAVVVAVGHAAGQQAAVRPIATIKQLHETMITPASDAIFKAAQEPPKDAAAWTALGNQAIVLSEAGNLLMLGTRAKDKGVWMRMSRGLVDAAASAVKAADAKNLDGVSDAGDRIVAACETCHAPYRDNGRKMGR